MAPVLSYGDMRAQTGVPRPALPENLIAQFQSFNWHGTFQAFARLAAVHAHPEDDAKNAFLQAHVLGILKRAPPFAAYLARTPRAVIVNEAAIYFCQAMAILYGSVHGQTPDALQVAILLLHANDYCFEWAETDARPLTEDDALLAETVRVSLLNQTTPMLQDYVRGIVMLERVPPRDRAWQKPESWAAFQHDALGMSLREYALLGAAPLFMLSATWGPWSGRLNAPTLKLDRLPRAASAPAATAHVLGQLVADRAEARTAIGAHLKDGLPVGMSFFFHKPFLKFPGGLLVAASPWAVRAHLHYGLWAHHLAAAKRLDHRNGFKRWSSAFGDIFEEWCRAAARDAYAGLPRANAEALILSTAIGDSDEIADLVISSGTDAVLFSVKSRMLPEPYAKRAQSRSQVVDWYEQLLFAPAGHGKDASWHRMGAIRALAKTAHEIANGKHAQLDPTSRIYPVVVTYDDVGGDNMLVNRWLAARCKQEGLLQGERARPPTMIDVRGFENLMGLAAHGVNIPRLFAEKTSARWRLETLDVFLHHRRVLESETRLPTIAARFDELQREMMDELTRGLAR